ncbi:MAG: hypothetical protein AB7Q29_11110 [Vicinamibacterales bacterium]
MCRRRRLGRELESEIACALVATLALGIGVTTAVFSVVYGVLLKPLPFDDPDRLVAVNHRLPGFGVARQRIYGAPRVFLDLRESGEGAASIGSRD